jgi:hypothetical protein
MTVFSHQENSPASKRIVKITVEIPTAANYFLSPMEPQPKSRGFFRKGNKYGKGRPFGSRNKPKDYPFMKDGSTMVSAQRFRTLASRMAFDLGGRENLTEAQQQLIRRCAMISAQCELMEQETVGGKPLNAIAYGTLTGHLTRTLNALGLKREPIDVTPALHEYLDTLQAPAEPPDLVAVASADEGEN